MSGNLTVLPLGGLGEIGKNMTVVEYDDRLVVVDAGLRFPTTDMLGIDLVLPDFSYLRERADDIEAIVITHGHEDHLGRWKAQADVDDDDAPVVLDDGHVLAYLPQPAEGQDAYGAHTPGARAADAPAVAPAPDTSVP